MASFGNAVLDAGLQVIRDTATHLLITSAEATTFAQANTTLKLGTKAAPTISAQEDAAPGTGRRVRVVSFADGVTDNTGTATHYALVNTAGSVLLSTSAISNPQVVTAGNPWNTQGNDVSFTLRQPV